MRRSRNLILVAVELVHTPAEAVTDRMAVEFADHILQLLSLALSPLALRGIEGNLQALSVSGWSQSMMRADC